MPAEFLAISVALVALCALATVWPLSRRSRRTTTTHTVPRRDLLPTYPEAGLLVSEEVFRALDSTFLDIQGALERASMPVAIEYYPLTPAEVSKLKTVPINATAQQALTDIVKAVNPKNPTLFRAVLPKGAELVKAVGQSGFRGFSRTGGETVHAVLKPVAVGGVVIAGWPALAVAGAVLVTDMVAQREMRAHQRRVESLLRRQEERAYRQRIAAQTSIDEQLSRAMGLMLDGKESALELALAGASNEFSLARQFLREHDGIVERIADEDGKIDYRRLEETLGGKERDVDTFVRELHLARAAVSLQRKAVVADAAARALEDPANPYLALRKFYDLKVEALVQAEAAVDGLTEKLGAVELKGRWHDRVTGRFQSADKSIGARQHRFRQKIAPPKAEDDETTLDYVMLPSGEVRQVVFSEPPMLEASVVEGTDAEH